MKLLAIIIGTFMIIITVWATLWLWGEGHQYQPYDHPLMNMQSPVMALQTTHYEEALKFIEENPTYGVALALRMSADGHFFTADSEELSFISSLKDSPLIEYKGNKHFYYDFGFLKEMAPGIVPLDTWMNLKPGFWIFDLQDNALKIDQYLIAYIKKHELQNQVIIKSDIDLVISSIKSAEPLWIYGSTLSDLNKLLTLDSMKLIGLANFQRDFFFSPLEYNGRNLIKESVIKEIRKRHKKVVLGPVHTDLDRERAMSFKPDILLIEKLSSDKKDPQ